MLPEAKVRFSAVATGPPGLDPTTFADNFNRANGSPGAPWAALGTKPAPLISGNQLTNFASVKPPGYTGDSIEFGVTLVSASYALVSLQWGITRDASGNPDWAGYYFINNLAGNASLNKQHVDGTLSNFGTLSGKGTPTAGDVFRVVIDSYDLTGSPGERGHAFTIYKNGIEIYAADEDSDPIPIAGATATIGLDNLLGTNVWEDFWASWGGEPDIPGTEDWFAECEITAITIRHGRDDPTSQPEADAATIEMLGPLPSGLDIGSGVLVVARLAGVDYPRFFGRVTDLALGWETLPDSPVSQVIATGHLAGMGHILIGTDTMPAEMDGTRANRVITDAGVPTDAARSDAPGTIHVIARTPDRQPALQIAQEAAEDGGGMLWETTDGKVVYADALHRDGAVINLALDPCTIPLEITWARTLEGLVNDVLVTYYDAGTAYEQHVWDDTSIARHGMYAASLSTRIAGEGDAITRGARLIFAQAEPSWRVMDVGVHLELLAKMGLTGAEDLAYTAGILGLEIHNLLKLAGMPYGSPINPSYLFIEGWTETLTFGSWHIAFAVSDYCQTASAETWDELDSVTTWHTYEGDSGDVTWDQLPCHPPPGA